MASPSSPLYSSSWSAECFSTSICRRLSSAIRSTPLRVSLMTLLLTAPIPLVRVHSLRCRLDRGRQLVSAIEEVLRVLLRRIGLVHEILRLVSQRLRLRQDCDELLIDLAHLLTDLALVLRLIGLDGGLERRNIGLDLLQELFDRGDHHLSPSAARTSPRRISILAASSISFSP